MLEKINELKKEIESIKTQLSNYKEELNFKSSMVLNMNLSHLLEEYHELKPYDSYSNTFVVKDNQLNDYLFKIIISQDKEWSFVTLKDGSYYSGVSLSYFVLAGNIAQHLMENQPKIEDDIKEYISEDIEIYNKIVEKQNLIEAQLSTTIKEQKESQREKFTKDILSGKIIEFKSRSFSLKKTQNRDIYCYGFRVDRVSKSGKTCFITVDPQEGDSNRSWKTEIGFDKLVIDTFDHNYIHWDYKFLDYEVANI